MSKQLITETLVKGEIDMAEFVRQYLKQECQGNIIQTYKFQLNAKDANINYLTLCFRFFNDEAKSYYYHSASRIAYTNQLCSSCKPQEDRKDAQGKSEKPNSIPKFCLLRFKALTSEEIASGDYVMPPTDGLTEEAIIALKAKYDKNIADLVAANELLIMFHTALNYEWIMYNQRLKTATKDPTTGKDISGFISAQCFVGSTILDKIETKNKMTGTVEVKVIDPPRYTWKIPVFTPHSKSSDRAKAFTGRLGQVFMTNDEFIPAVLDMEISKKANAEGKKGLVEAQLVGTKNGAVHKESLTYANVAKYITRKSRMSGYIDCSNSIITQTGHYYRILAPHCIVKRHKTVEANKDLSEQYLEKSYEADDGFAEIADTGINFDALETGLKGARTPSSVHGDTSALNDIPLNIGNGLQYPQQQYPQQQYPQAQQQYPQVYPPQGYPQAQQPPQGYPQAPQGYPQAPQGYPQAPQAQYPQAGPNPQYMAMLLQNKQQP